MRPAEVSIPTRSPGLLGDTSTRDYSHKLRLFNAFVEPELRSAISGLGLKRGMRVLDAGCGTGEALGWLYDAVAPDGRVIGIDLAAAHVSAARAHASARVLVLQGDVRSPPLAPQSVDLVWSANILHHLHEPLEGVQALTALLAPGGRIAVGQSSLLPEMFFAWDAPLEQRTTEAVRRYYRDRYALSESELAATRGVVGLLRRAGLHNVMSRTVVIERIAPLAPADEAYLLEAIFRDTWGERLRPYLSVKDFAELTALCDPGHSAYALRRPDFHFLQTFTLVTAESDQRPSGSRDATESIPVIS
jgi:SAM-dependent methyltransferase